MIARRTCCGAAALMVGLLVPRSGCAQEQIRVDTAFVLDGRSVDLQHITHLEAGPHGQVVIDQSNAVWVVDARGQVVDRFGRRGGGPGEFLAISSMGWKGDSIWVFDGRQGRFTVGVSGDATWNVYRGPQTAVGAVGLVFPKMFAASGAITATLLGSAQPTLYSLDLSGQSVKELATWQYADEGLLIHAGSRTLSFAYPYQHRVVVAYAPDASGFALAEPMQDGGDAGRFRLTRFDENGDTVFRRIFHPKAVPITADEHTALLHEWSERERPELQPLYRKHDQIPDFYPPVSGVVLDPAGDTWLRVPQGSGDWSYLRLDRTGAQNGRLSLPKGMTLLGAAGRRMWVVEVDDLGVESLYGLIVRPAADSTDGGA